VQKYSPIDGPASKIAERLLLSYEMHLAATQRHFGLSEKNIYRRQCFIIASGICFFTTEAGL